MSLIKKKKGILPNEKSEYLPYKAEFLNIAKSNNFTPNTHSRETYICVLTQSGNIQKSITRRRDK
jgi:hypothetical protein